MVQINQINYDSALIVGAGSGLSAAIARAFADAGMRIALASRTTGDLGPVAERTGAKLFSCDATSPQQVKKLFEDVSGEIGAPEVVVYNAGYQVGGKFLELDPERVSMALAAGAFGGFLVAQEAVRRMLPRGQGAVLFTGASASVKGYPQSAPFAMGKFALRGLAQSMARELAPQGIHVAHFVIDGGIRSADRPDPPGRPDSMLDPDAIAATYLHVLRQPRSAWTWEVELRPWVEKF
jgi:NAD(P)-dependent dehydrogenase (short-subunit alcohol dehydrogenase family)